MAGTIVKQEVIGGPGTKAVMKAMGWSERETLGCLVLLWNGSQNRGLVRASARQIGAWCQIEDREEIQRLIDALSSETAGYLKRGRLDEFEIVGNRREIAALKALKTGQKRGGARTKAKWASGKGLGNSRQDAEQGPMLSSVVPSPPNPTHLFPSPPSLRRMGTRRSIRTSSMRRCALRRRG